MWKEVMVYVSFDREIRKMLLKQLITKAIKKIPPAYTLDIYLWPNAFKIFNTASVSFPWNQILHVAFDFVFLVNSLSFTNNFYSHFSLFILFQKAHIYITQNIYIITQTFCSFRRFFKLNFQLFWCSVCLGLDWLKTNFTRREPIGGLSRV